MIKLSVVLAVRNEEKFLGACLNSVQGLADEIVIFDEESVDATMQIAKKFHARVFSTPHKDNFHLTKKKAIKEAKGEWILQLDADEIVCEELKKEIARVISTSPTENGFWLPRANFFLGRFLKKGGAYPDYTLRLYRRGKGDLPGRDVHEQAKVVGETSYLKNDLLHYADATFERYINRFNRYTDLEARKVSGGFMSNIFIKPLIDSRQGFLAIYIHHLGFFDGFPGFIWALFSALHFPIAYFKSLEK